jgi:hypothetical protein
MTLAAETRATTVRVPTVPDHVRLVWAGSLPRRRLDDKAAGSWDRKERLMGSTRRTPPATPARRVAAPAALVHRLVEEACNGGNLAALDAVLPPPSPTDPAMATRLTVTFTPTPDGTQLDLTHDRLDGLRDRYPHIAEQVGPGWESALEALVAVGW